MELRSIERKEDEYELVEVIIGGKAVMQAFITIDNDEFIITKYRKQDDETMMDAILDEYVENPPS